MPTLVLQEKLVFVPVRTVGTVATLTRKMQAVRTVREGIPFNGGKEGFHHLQILRVRLILAGANAVPYGRDQPVVFIEGVEKEDQNNVNGFSSLRVS